MSLKGKILKELEKKPRRLKELKARLGNDKKVTRLMDELVKKKQVFVRDGMYCVAARDMEKALKCRLVKLARTFGFAQPVEGGADVFIPGKYLLGAMPGDLVLVTLDEHPRRAGTLEGKVIAIAEENKRFGGEVTKLDGRLALLPDACPHVPLLIKKGADGGARIGEKAAVEILERGENHADHRAGVSMRFGAADVASHCAKALLYSVGISRHFPASVKEEAKVYENARLREKDCKGRRDLRDWAVFTIDSASTKDIDDAISLTRTENGYALGVHIADVSHYVRPGSALDKEAFSRGTSVYYADSVVPMLPRQLSNGICSLNEGEDRLAFSCLMQLDRQGGVIDYEFCKTVIRSRVKGVYSEVNAILDGSADNAVKVRYAQVAEQLPLMQEVYEKLAARRLQRGAMNIESDEAKILVDESGRCTGVEKRVRGVSECMIEEFMLLANMCAARLAKEKDIPFVYRVHDQPEAERVEALKKALLAMKVDAGFAGETPTVKELAALLDATRDTPLERAVHTNVLRSMAKAKYEPQPKGHFGLALADYAHFTSPIRRYPDLAIHRILGRLCAGASADEIRQQFTGFAAEASVQSSECEVRAMKAERDIDDCYKAEYMQQFIGEEFDAVVASVTSFGLYVELPNTVEGLVRADALSTRELQLIDGVALVEPLGGRRWAVGDRMRVTLAGVDVAAGNVDFEPARGE
ncbi:ribonuclease R [Ruthenibacterium sp. CLA-JM-H11]|uniref:Ribonuclease R n=1 Tax=Ruthenibacterium intestinale TaxID=3133163 RepID=A0ABV1GGE0_9FIRM